MLLEYLLTEQQKKAKHIYTSLGAANLRLEH